MNSLWSESVFMMAENDEVLDGPNPNGLYDVMWSLVWDHARICEGAHVARMYGEMASATGYDANAVDFIIRSLEFNIILNFRGRLAEDTEVRKASR